MNLKDIMLSERRYIHKFICSTIPFIEQCGKSKTVGKGSYQWIPGGSDWLLEGNLGMMESSVVAQLYTFFKTYKAVCEFYLHKFNLLKRNHYNILNHTHNN